jgi:hypothetical protein
MHERRRLHEVRRLGQHTASKAQSLRQDYAQALAAEVRAQESNDAAKEALSDACALWSARLQRSFEPQTLQHFAHLIGERERDCAKTARLRSEAQAQAAHVEIKLSLARATERALQKRAKTLARKLARRREERALGAFETLYCGRGR